jgi:guanylate kinase
MEKASKELAFSSEFDCILINDNLDEACVKAEQLVIDFLEKQ